MNEKQNENMQVAYAAISHSPPLTQPTHVFRSSVSAIVLLPCIAKDQMIKRKYYHT